MEKINFWALDWELLKSILPFLGLLLIVMAVAVAIALWRRRVLGIKDAPFSLEEALSRGEGQGIEFKKGVPKKILAYSIAAFANTNHGSIFLGVNDEGRVEGLTAATLKEKDEILHVIRHLTAHEIKPPILLRYDFLEHDGKTVLRLFVPHGKKPVYMVDGVIYRRHMNSVTKATPEQVEEMFRAYLQPASED